MVNPHRSNLPVVLLSHPNLEAAIEKGVGYLERIQGQAGDFEMVSSPHQDMRAAKPYSKSAYVATYVLHTLSLMEATPQIESIQQRTIAFLLQEQKDNGGWQYCEQPASMSFADLDTTACVIAALAQVDRQPELSFYALLWNHESAPGGPYYTWLDVDYHELDPSISYVDAQTNANITYCCRLLGLSLPKTVYYLEQVISAQAYESECPFSISAHFPIYLLSRAYAADNGKMLDKVMPTIQDYILSKLAAPHSEGSMLNLACLAVSLLNMKVPSILVRPYLVPLLASQQSDGGWPVYAACTRKAFRADDVHYDGGTALTTAIALEALYKYYVG